MKSSCVALVTAGLLLVGSESIAQTAESQLPRRITLREAVDLALQKNHVVRLARLDVEEQQHVQRATRSAYFPSVRNDTNAAHVSDTQLIELPPGSLGAVGNSLIPPQPLTINQGGLSFASTGFGIAQPLLQLFK